MPLLLLLKLKSFASLILKYAIKYWKITIILILLATNVYANNKVDNLEQDAVDDARIIQQLQDSNESLIAGVEEQNTAVEEGHAKYNTLLAQQQAYITRIAELDSDLLIVMATITDEAIGSECSDKIQYLRDSARELTW